MLQRVQYLKYCWLFWEYVLISQSEIVPPTSIVCSKLLLDGCNNGDGRSSSNDNGNNDDENNDDSDDDDDGGNGSIRFLPNMFLFLIAILPMILWLMGHNFIFVWWNSYI